MPVNNYQVTPLDPGRSFLQGQAMGQQLESNRLSDLIRQQQADQQQQMGALKIDQMQRQNQVEEFRKNLTGVGLIGAAFKEAKPESPEQAAQIFNMMKGQLGDAGYDISDLGEFDPQQMPKYAQAYNAARSAGLLQSDSDAIPAGLREFTSIMDEADLTPEQRKQAARVKLGLDPRATGSAAQTIADRGVAEQVGESQAVIEDRTTRAKKEAENATGVAKEYFEQLGNVEENIANYAEAKRLVQEEGADTGAIQGRLPSMRAAAVKLRNLQGELGLDIIGDTTFGALSESELAFALDVALPTDLDGPALVEWLDRKMAAQQKVADYLNNAIQFLSIPGNKISDLQAESPRAQAAQATSQPQQSTAPATFTSQSGVTFTVED